MDIHDYSLITEIPSLTVTHTAVTSGSADTTRPDDHLRQRLPPLRFFPQGSTEI
jgi:hypothetical protein